MKGIVLSGNALRIYVSFLTDIAAGLFLGALASPTWLELTYRLAFSIMYLILAIILGRKR